MPLYKKKYSRSGKPYYKKRRGNIYYRRSVNKADKALSLAKYAVRSLNVEVKSVTKSVTAQSVGTTGVIFNLAEIPQGDGFNNRDGRSVKIQQLNMKGTMTIDPTVQQTRMRILIVKKIDNNLTLPTIGEVLDSSIINSLRNLNNTDNLKVLSDKRYAIDQSTNSNILWSINKQMSMRQQYQIGATGGVGTNLERNGLYLIALSDQTITVPNLTFQSRVRFVDN